MGSYKKKLFIALLLFLLISFFLCSSVKAVSLDVQYTVDQPTLLKDQQEYLASIFLSKFDKIATDTQKEDLKTSVAQGEYYFLFSYVNINNTCRINLYRMSINIKYSDIQETLVNTSDEYFEDVYFTYPVSGYAVTNNDVGNMRLYSYNISNNTMNISYTATNCFIPSALIYYQNNTLKNYYNGIVPNSSSIAMIMQKIEENTTATEDVKQEMQKMNTFLNSDDVEENSYSMPSNSDNPTQDVTADGVNNIFNLFYDSITSWTSPSINVPIPFTNKSFVIPANTTENILKKFSGEGFGSILKYLINLVWYYLLGRYIVKDVSKYVDGLKTGEILTKSDTNIKTEML